MYQQMLQNNIVSPKTYNLRKFNLKKVIKNKKSKLV